jgi:hypothetical protein
MMWFLSGIGNVPTPNVPSDVWDCVESYMIHMLLVCRLKIIATSNLKLIVSFLVLNIVLLSLFKLLSLVASTRHTHSTLCIKFRLANRPSARQRDNQWVHCERRWSEEQMQGGAGATRGDVTTSRRVNERRRHNKRQREAEMAQ